MTRRPPRWCARRSRRRRSSPRSSTSCSISSKSSASEDATDYHDAVAFLDAHIGYGIRPGLERITGLLDVLGDPQDSYPIIHVTGTNGKTSTTRIASDILGAHGLTVGTFTSPHLVAVEERVAVAGRSLAPEAFAAAIEDIAPFVTIFEERGEDPPTYFELMAALGLTAFASQAVDVAVVEVGLGGRLDATNVVNAAVAVITGIAKDHTSYLGDSLSSIAAEKVAIVKPGSVLVSAALPAAAEGSVTARIAEVGAPWRRYGTDFRLEEAVRAVGGWMCQIDGIYQTYADVYLALHGRHQAANLTTAVAACEAFFGRALDPEAIREAAAGTTSPGRLEVLRRRPLVLLDGAHNVEGFDRLAEALVEEFPALPWTLVVGIRGHRPVGDMLAPLRGLVGDVVVVAADDPLALPVADVAAGVRETLGEVPIHEIGGVADGVATALDRAGGDGGVLVAGSLYVVGEARAALTPDSETSAT